MNMEEGPSVMGMVQGRFPRSRAQTDIQIMNRVGYVKRRQGRENVLGSRNSMG